MRIQFDQVGQVQLVDGWHEVEPGTFRLTRIRFGPGTEPADGDADGDGDVAGQWPEAFAFEAPDGEAFAGPLSSLLAVTYQVPDKPQPTAYEELVRRLNGKAVTVDGSSTVRFTHADHEFDVWLGPSGTWRYVESAKRSDTSPVDTYLPEPDVQALMSQMMADLKGTWGLGRPPAPPVSHDGPDHDTGSAGRPGTTTA